MPSLSAYEEWLPVEAWMRGKAGPALRWELEALQALGWDAGPWGPPWGWGKSGDGPPAPPSGVYQEHALEEYGAWTPYEGPGKGHGGAARALGGSSSWSGCGRETRDAGRGGKDQMQSAEGERSWQGSTWKPQNWLAVRHADDEEAAGDAAGGSYAWPQGSDVGGEAGGWHAWRPGSDVGGGAAGWRSTERGWSGRSWEMHDRSAPSGDTASNASACSAGGGGNRGGRQRPSAATAGAAPPPAGLPPGHQDQAGMPGAVESRVPCEARDPRALTDAQLRTLAGKAGPIHRAISRETLAYALLHREALRSLERFKEADAIREDLAGFGFHVRDAEKLEKSVAKPGGNQAAFFVIFEAQDRRYIIDRGWFRFLQ